ncbi:MAG: ribbon-helix-helix protein, CopG family [Deltaproteobacteria bacterium]|nr:ribbon-helix-helix protein, CopG family [Deltaproteobacteria bacterium]
MTCFKHIEERASEVVTVRLTLGQKRVLDRLAKRAKMTKSELIRSWIDEKKARGK